jgi:dipeptidyl aminopeptidase/acylaminoacyl peptidase
MHEALEKRGVKSPLVIFPDEGHGAQKRENKVLQIGYAMDFFATHLGKKTMARVAAGGAKPGE